ncbi:MAG TPA: hypothetical protein VGL89_07810 [Candidatus Koribacter sp.]|jgi:hypothetical protein
MKHGLALAALIISATTAALADCYPFDQAQNHVGEIICVRGRVIKVSASPSRTHYLNFCENYLSCPFTVVIFPSRLEQIGDVRSLENHEIEIDGLVKLYNGHPEIVLSELSQLHGAAATRIPPLPKNYDVSEHGKFSAGTTYAKKPSSKKKKSQPEDPDPFSE